MFLRCVNQCTGCNGVTLLDQFPQIDLRQALLMSLRMLKVLAWYIDPNGIAKKKKKKKTVYTPILYWYQEM